MNGLLGDFSSLGGGLFIKVCNKKIELFVAHFAILKGDCE